jgi:hypothetical protein
LREEAAAAVVEHLLRVEKAELLERLRAGLMRRDVFERLSSDVDARLPLANPASSSPTPQ